VQVLAADAKDLDHGLLDGFAWERNGADPLPQEQRGPV
jgi:hypothetical protein